MKKLLIALIILLFPHQALALHTMSYGHSLPFTSGGTYEVVVGNTITGATSGSTAVITKIDLDSGTWAGGDAAGKLFYDTVIMGILQQRRRSVKQDVFTLIGIVLALSLVVGLLFLFVGFLLVRMYEISQSTQEG